jgi:hypothetical protein
MSYQASGKATTKQHKDTSHGLHLALTICTCGLWGIVWAAMVVWHKVGPRKKTVTYYR